MLLFKDLEQKIIKIIHDSQLPVDGIYFVMKHLMQEIEYEYFDFCKKDAEAAQQTQKELNKENEEITTTAADNENKEEGTN